MTHPTILITGATGFVGGHLLSAMRGDHDVRILVRDASKLSDDAGIDVVEGDLDDTGTLDRALDGIECAYYLVHSMEPGGSEDGFARRDRELAKGFVAAAERAGVGRIAYLGGVVPDGERSEHLDSRFEVEEILGSGAPGLIALRAAMIVGAESDSFRTLAQIVDRLPILALPSWRDTCMQPVAISDVIAALAAAPSTEPGVYDVGGPDAMSVATMIETLGDLLGGAPPSVKLPFSSSRLEGAAAAMVTDSSREVLTPLMDGLHEDLTVEDNALEPVFGITPTPFVEAARSALVEMGHAHH